MRRQITLEQIPLTKPKHFLKTEIYYNLGGMNYFSGNTQERGYYLGVTPVEIDEHFTKTTAFSGTCALLQKSARFSAGKMQEVADKLKSQPIYQQLIDHVKAKNNIKFASEEEVPATPIVNSQPVTPEAEEEAA